MGAVIVGAGGDVLAFERSDVAGAWQLPQGGLEPGEEPGEAVLREIREETGIGEDWLEPLGRHPEPLVYELPAAARSPKTGRGQVQYWFYFRLTGAEDDIVLPDGGEFRAWRWMPFERLLDEVVEFRRPVYRRLQEWLAARPA